MFILGIAGSPRKGGNTETLLDEALASAQAQGARTEKVLLSSTRIAPCMGCGACERTGECIQKDGMQKLYDTILSADVILFASPIYFYSVSGTAKCAIDRTQALWSRKYKLKDERYYQKKKGYFISVSASKGERVFEGAQLVMKYFFDAAGYELTGELLIKGIDSNGEIKKHPAYLQAARELGEEAAGRT
ncbi:flavodoxin family protein [Dehalobacter sp. DCM]|uniref:flavodoxin family protein n=1 Tax=Dehalobacter sp. DCM TaxID=2907827 RepID=UPI0030815599|nr:flavodoxin family protein [Dehalobacter sp. DCM]